MKKSGCAILFLFVVMCASLFGNLLLLTALGGREASSGTASRLFREKNFEETVLVEGASSQNRVAVIPLEGVIATGQPGSLGSNMITDFKRALQQALDDETIKAAIVLTDSPGGEITASDVLYHAIKQFSQRKPIIMYFNSLGASGAYYAGCGASWIMCNDTTLTGSIGVIISTLNYRELLGKVGLDAVVFRSGKFKDMLSGAREMTEEERQYVQGLVMQSYGRFVGIVAVARKLDEQKLREGVADGRILSGVDAKEAGLVDELGYVENAYAKAAEMANVQNPQVVQYRRGLSFADFLSFFGEAHAPKIEINMLAESAKLLPGRVYLLPAIFAP